VIHELPLERRTLHGHFSRDLQPILTIDSGDTIAFPCLDAGWHVAPGKYFEPRDETLDSGHALIGPIEVRGARKGQTLAVRIDAVRVGELGFTVAAGWPSWLNDALALGEGAEKQLLRWSLDADAGLARDDHGRRGSSSIRFSACSACRPTKPVCTRRGRRAAAAATSTARS
jgi:acetamidase/formamidase